MTGRQKPPLSHPLYLSLHPEARHSRPRAIAAHTELFSTREALPDESKSTQYFKGSGYIRGTYVWAGTGGGDCAITMNAKLTDFPVSFSSAKGFRASTSDACTVRQICPAGAPVTATQNLERPGKTDAVHVPHSPEAIRDTSAGRELFQKYIFLYKHEKTQRFSAAR